MVNSISNDKNILSKYEIDTINLYKTKYQKFPGPSDKEVLDVSNILLSKSLSRDTVKQLLGEPSDISKIPESTIKRDLLYNWSYDIGDSRRITIFFDSNGNISSISGTGVGFDILTTSKEI